MNEVLFFDNDSFCLLFCVVSVGCVCLRLYMFGGVSVDVFGGVCVCLYGGLSVMMMVFCTFDICFFSLQFYIFYHSFSDLHNFTILCAMFKPLSIFKAFTIVLLVKGLLIPHILSCISIPAWQAASSTVGIGVKGVGSVEAGLRGGDQSGYRGVIISGNSEKKINKT